MLSSSDNLKAAIIWKTEETTEHSTQSVIYCWEVLTEVGLSYKQQITFPYVTKLISAGQNMFGKKEKLHNSQSCCAVFKFRYCRLCPVVTFWDHISFTLSMYQLCWNLSSQAGNTQYSSTITSIRENKLFIQKNLNSRITILYSILSDVDCFTIYDPTLRIEVFACFLGNTVSRGPWLHWVWLWGLCEIQTDWSRTEPGLHHFPLNFVLPNNGLPVTTVKWAVS